MGDGLTLYSNKIMNPTNIGASRLYCFSTDINDHQICGYLLN